jgi:hypothetical protein
MRKKEKLWSAWVEEWKKSSLSRRRYCEERRLALPTFQWWRSRLRGPEGSAGKQTTLVCVGVPSGFSAAELARLLDVLEARSC